MPGAFGGWLAMLREHGTLRLRDVLRFAVGYAEEGYPMLERIAGAIRDVEQLFRDDWTSSAEVYLPVPAPGTLHRNRALAATYRRILEEAEATSADRDRQIEAAHDCWYRGFVAEEIVGFQEREWLDSSGERHAGLLADGRPARVAGRMGGAALGRLPRPHGVQGRPLEPGARLPAAAAVARRLRPRRDGPCERRVRPHRDRVREARLRRSRGVVRRPAFVDVPLEELLSSEYADERRRLVGEESSAELRPGSPGGREPRLAGPVEGAPVAPGVGEPTRGDTVHVDVVDRFGNMVAATPSGGWLHGAPVIPALGFCLGTRAQMFWLEEGLPNSLEPGKRPRTTLSPSIAARDGEPYLAFGTPGGDQQDQWTLQVFLAHVHFGMDLQAAIDAPNHHTEAFPSSFYPRETRPRHVAVEERAGEDTFAGLRKRGHDVEVEGAWTLGRVSAAAREPDGVLKAAANPARHAGLRGRAVRQQRRRRPTCQVTERYKAFGVRARPEV